MKPIEKPNVLGTVCDTLRGEIRDGRWRARLPGTRALAAKLGVSATTVGKALDRLTEEGLLECGGARRAYRLSAKAVAKSSRGRAGRKRELLILAGHQARHRVDNARQMVETLLDRVAGRGWVVRHQTLAYFHAKRPHKDWERRIVMNEETKVIAVSGSPSLAEWATRRNIPMMFLGGDTGGFPVPVIGVSSARMAEDALAKVTAAGHRRIVLPFVDRSARFKEKLKAVHQAAIERAGGLYAPEYHNPESDYSAPDVMWRILAKLFESSPPTALILFDWEEMVAAHCFLAARGLRVPGDVSLVLLSDPVTAEWFLPKLCRFRYPEKKIVSLTLGWLDGRHGCRDGAILSGEWIDGDSIGQCPPAKPEVASKLCPEYPKVVG